MPNRHRQTVIALTAAIVVLSALSAYLFFRMAEAESRLAGMSPAVQADVLPAAAGGVTFTEIEGDQESGEPELPAPSGEAEGEPLPPVTFSSVGGAHLRRVNFSPEIGDVFRIHYDRRAGTLLMAVVEPSGLRSIWRLDRDLSLRRVLEENDREGEIFLGADSRGVVYAGFADPGTLYRSADLGESWVLASDNIDGVFWNIADNGRGILWGGLHAYNKALLYRSLDDGLTWEVWRDFHEVFPEYAKTYRDGDDRFALRHLHSVAYHHDRLFVGVGDVARFTVVSEDGGREWHEVWSEGFTASVPLVDGSGLILGPDRLQAHGLAVYIFASGRTEEVWSPIPYGYSGYTYSLIEADGIYYAAFHTETNEVGEFAGQSGVIVSPNGWTWYPFLTFEKLTNAARTDIFLAPGEPWGFGYMSLNGALYRFDPPLGRWFDLRQPFGR